MRGIGFGQPFGHRHDRAVRVERRKAFGGGLDLQAAEIAGPEENLTLQIGQGDAVVVSDGDAPHARSGEVQKNRCAQTARAANEHLRR